MTTNSKKIIDANKRHILNCYKGKGGATAFVKEIDHYRTYPDTYGQAYRAMNYVIQAPDLLWRTVDVERYLHSIGLIDDRRIERFGGAWELYTALMKRDGIALWFAGGNKCHVIYKNGRIGPETRFYDGKYDKF